VQNLAYSLMGFVNRIYKWNSDMAKFDFELRQDGVAKGFCGDAGAVRDKENAGMGHEILSR